MDLMTSDFLTIIVKYKNKTKYFDRLIDKFVTDDQLIKISYR